MQGKKELHLKERLLENYDVNEDQQGISGKRIATRLGEIAKIGLTEQQGSNRPGFSKEEQEAKQLVACWMEEAGLEVQQDGAGNIIGRLEGKQQDLPAIVSGSHVDSVPNGGHFDGVLGVIGALEVVEAWKETNYVPEKPFEVVIFSDEEGARFNSGLSGSEGMMGTYDLEEKQALKDSEGRSFAEVLGDVGLSEEGYQTAKRSPQDFEMFVELHIEQGKRLEQKDLPCGIVTGIAGPSWLEFTFIGEAGHAGNTPMNDRKDPLVAAGEFIGKVNALPEKIGETAVATIGKLNVFPNGANVIPGRVSLYVDLRDIYKETRDKLIEQTVTLAKEIAKKHAVEVNYDELTRVPPVPIEQRQQDLLKETFESLNLTPYYLPSGAGHDAMVLGEKMPIAMIFVRSKDGISHNPKEWSDLADCVKGVLVLKNFIEKLQV